MRTPLSRFTRAIAFFGIVLVCGALGYMAFGWSVLDSFFMMVITIFSVGYGEVRELETPLLKIYTMLVIFAGTGSAFYVFGTAVQMITEGELRQALGARRMSQGIDHMKNHAIVCGFGRIGRIISQQLHDSGYPFVVMDSDPQRIHSAQELGYSALEGNALEEQDLRRAHVERAAVLATVLPSDADNVFITLSARNLNPDVNIIARGEMPNTERKLRQAGASHVIMPADIGGRRIAELILHPGNAPEERLGRVETFGDDLREMGLQLRAIVVGENDSLVGMPVHDLTVSGKDPFIIVGVRDIDGRTICGAHSNHALQPGNQVMAIGAQGDVPLMMARKPRRA